VSDLPLPLAARLRRPGWRDTRLVVGVLLVLGSVVLGSTVMRAADARSPVFTARSALVPGQRLTETDLVRVDVHLGALSDLYVAAGAALAPHQVVLRVVPAGELVPRAAVGSQAQVAVQPLTLMVTAGAASTLQVGSEVDVYADLPAAGAGTGAIASAGPELVLRRVAVSSLPENGSALGGSTTGDHAVQVMVPTERVKDLIGQVDRGARVTLVPVAGTTVRVDR
jgi:hypothetical protein